MSGFYKFDYQGLIEGAHTYQVSRDEFSAVLYVRAGFRQVASDMGVTDGDLEIELAKHYLFSKGAVCHDVQGQFVMTYGAKDYICDLSKFHIEHFDTLLEKARGRT